MGSLLLPGTCEHRSSSQGLLFSWPPEIEVGRRGQVGSPPHLLLPCFWSLQKHEYTQRQTDTHTPSQDLGTDPLHPSQGLEETVLLKDDGKTSPRHTIGALTMAMWYKNASVSYRRPSVCHLGVWPGASCSGEACTLQVLWQYPALLAGLLQPPLGLRGLLLAQVLAPLVLALLHLFYHVL